MMVFKQSNSHSMFLDNRTQGQLWAVPTAAAKSTIAMGERSTDMHGKEMWAGCRGRSELLSEDWPQPRHLEAKISQALNPITDLSGLPSTGSGSNLDTSTEL